jgi:pimeloyl-ACP methyl ester carboxylesterase
MWEPQSAVAETGWRLVLPQLRGMDGVDETPVSSMDDYAADVIDLLDALHLHDAVIGGLSMGGYVSLAVFRHAASYFRGLVLADTRPHADTEEAAAGRTRLLALVREKGPSAVADEMVPKLLGEASLQRPEVVQKVRSLILSNSTTAIAGAITAMLTRPDSKGLLGSIHCPTLILVGEHDKLTPPSVAAELHESIAGSELVTIPGAGHLANLEQPEAFNAALARFLTHRV